MSIQYDSVRCKSQLPDYIVYK